MLNLRTRTELHTHLMGLLSAKEFIEFLADINYKFPVDDKHNIDFENNNVNRIHARELIDDKDVIKQLSIPHGTKVNYSMLNRYYLTRSMLLADAIEQRAKASMIDDKQKTKYVMYGLYIEACLCELVSQGVTYVEISFSNAKIIENAINYIDPSILHKIKCRFLLSTDRSKVSKDFKQSSKYMSSLIKQNLAVGFDVMGAEVPLSVLDMDRTSKFGLEQKLTPIIGELNKLVDTTLRIHSGETRCSSENTQKILTIIERIEKQLNIVIPPPQIRIGHGVHFCDNAEYIRLLKKFNCIIEINASSNYALDNIDNYSNIPYNYYLDRDIPVVICSDGHGMYDTTKQIEDIIAEINVSETNKKKIASFDTKIRKVK